MAAGMQRDDMQNAIAEAVRPIFGEVPSELYARAALAICCRWRHVRIINNGI
jgi:hypothetical protein